MLTHSRNDHDKCTLESVCLVSRTWCQIAYGTPILWETILRQPLKLATAPIMSRIHRTGDIIPLRLILHVGVRDFEILSLMFLVERFASRWRRINIHCLQFKSAASLLHATRRCCLPILDSITIYDSLPSSTPRSRNSLLSNTPCLRSLTINSCHLSHLTLARTLVDVMLNPCPGAARVFRLLKDTRVETLHLCQCMWEDAIDPVELAFLRVLSIEGIPRGVLRNLLGALSAPRLFQLNLVVKLDADLEMIIFEDSLDIVWQMPSLSRLVCTTSRFLIYTRPPSR